MRDAVKVALVTGGAKRVGKAIVERLVKAGYAIAFTYHSSHDEADALVEQIERSGGVVLAVKADLTNPSIAVGEIEPALRERFGRLDVLVHNASVYEPSELMTVDLDQMRRLWAVHVESPLLLTRAFADDLRESRGCVVTILDLLAQRPWPKYLAYCASKAALWNLTLGLARELAPEANVNGIAPGVVEWPADYPLAEQEKYLRRVPLARAGTPADVADAVHYLCTTGRYLTGQVLRLDGGRSIT